MQKDPSTPRVRVTVSPHSPELAPNDRKALLASARFALELLLAHLDEEVPLDGASKIEVRLGANGPDPRYERVGSRSVVYQVAFDYAAWAEAGASERDGLMLEALVAILDRVAQAFRCRRAPLKDAARRAVRAKFTARVPAPALASDVPFGVVGWTLQVLRVVSRAGESWILEISDKRGRVVRQEPVVDPAPREAPRPRFVDYEWSETEYRLLDDQGSVAFRVELAPDRARPAA